MSNIKLMTRDLAGWFLLGTGIIYATGFLVVLFHHERYGLRGIDNVLAFKTRYIYIGLVVIVFTVIPALPAAAIYAFRTDGSQRGKWTQMGPTGALLGSLLATLFYLPLVFGKPGAFSGAPFPIIFFAVVVVTLVLAWLSRRARQRHSRLGGPIVRLLFLGVLAVGFSFVLPAMADTLTKGFVKSALFVTALAASFGASAAMFFHAPSDTADREKGYRELFGCVVLGLIYVVIIRCFAALYRYIPADAGGGDLTSSSLVTCRLTAGSSLPATLLVATSDDTVETVALVLVEATATSLFVAQPDQNGGMAEWQRDPSRMPDIYELPRDRIVLVRYSEAHRAFRTSDERGPSLEADDGTTKNVGYKPDRPPG